MSYFRINLYLPIKYFLLSFFISEYEIKKQINKKLKSFSKKKEITLTSQLRVGFILLLKYLKQKNPDKKDIIINSYNLAEMVNICKNLKLNIIFTKLNQNLFFSKKDLIKKINKNTLAIVSTNIFNTYLDSLELKKICNKKKIPLIEDNAIYFGNFKRKKGKKIYAGSFGDYALNSFNIMKNISAMYGGSVASNDVKFSSFAEREIKKFNNFPFLKYAQQCIIYLILKTFSINFIYKIFFLKIIRKAHLNKNLSFLSLVYPSLKFKKQNLQKYYFTKINRFSLKMIYLQLKDRDNFNRNHLSKKKNNIYYQKTLSKLKIKGVSLLEYTDPSFQNYNDFPIKVKKKEKLVNYLFSKGIETKTVQYVDCQKIFKTKKSHTVLEEYENKILCLPNHRRISQKYIDYIVKCINTFYRSNK